MTGSLYAIDKPDVRALSAMGDRAFLDRDWYVASEYYREALLHNPAYLEAMTGLARSSYELGEYERALLQTREARKRAPQRADLAALEAFVLIALGDSAGAEGIIHAILKSEPYNRDALFAKAELGILAGRPSEASQLYNDIISRYPDDKRALVSLAILSHAMGNGERGRDLVVKAMRRHPDDERVYYHAAWLDAQEGLFERAMAGLEQALHLDKDYREARILLAQLQYRMQQYSSCIEQTDILLQNKRDDSLSWYLKARATEALDKYDDARALYLTALHHDKEDEIARLALTESLAAHTPLESPERRPLGNWFFSRAEEYRSQFQAQMALASYQLGLKLSPYAKERARYADLLAQSGLPGRQLEELMFMQDIGIADTAINDRVEAWESILADSVHRRWDISPMDIPASSWKLAVCVDTRTEKSLHVDASLLVSRLLASLLEREPHIALSDIAVIQDSYASAWRSAREAAANYLIMIEVSETARDFSVDAHIYSASSGSLLHTERVYQTGMDKVWNGTFRISQRIAGLFPAYSRILARKGNQVITGFGAHYALEEDTKLVVIKDSDFHPLVDRFILAPKDEQIIASLVPEEQDEYVTRAKVIRNGFFDRLAVGDPVIRYKKEEEGKTDSTGAERSTVSGEIREMIRAIR